MASRSSLTREIFQIPQGESLARRKVVSRSQTLFLHAEGKVGSGQLTSSRLFRFPKIIGGVGGSAI